MFIHLLVNIPPRQNVRLLAASWRSACEMHRSSAGKYRFRLRAEHRKLCDRYKLRLKAGREKERDRRREGRRGRSGRLFKIYRDGFATQIVFREAWWLHISYSVRVTELTMVSMSARETHVSLFLTLETPRAGAPIAVDDVIALFDNVKSC